MTSRYLTNILLILLVVGLYWFNNQSNTTDNIQQTISTISNNDIQQIMIERTDLDTIILEKQSGDWLLLAPLKAKANSTRIKLLLSLLSTTSYAQLADTDNETLRQLGLSPASVTLKFNEHSFQFGDTETLSNHRYVLHNGMVHLTDDNVIHLLKANASSFIENRLIQASNIIKKISLPLLSTNNIFSESYAIIKKSEGQWESKQTSYTIDQLTTLISVWQHAYALQVLPIESEDQQSTDLNKITIWYNNAEQSSELGIKLTDKALFIYDLEQQLKYQFPTALTQQLFPIEVATP